MKYHSILGNAQKLDGGAMFGNCPRALWSRWYRPDDDNRIELACRALLIEDGPRLILAETGIGAFMKPELRRRFGVERPEHLLLSNLKRAGFSPDDITHVILSHLHFDHAGGLLSAWEEGRAPTLLFPKATYIVGREAFERACRPHPRDRASFIPELQGLLEASGRLHLVGAPDDHPLGHAYRFRLSNGHTPGLIHLEVIKDRLIFASDLIPGAPWVHLPITMGYDRFPELVIDEKAPVLESLASEGGMLFFTHDPTLDFARVRKNERGRYEAVPAPALESVSG